MPTMCAPCTRGRAGHSCTAPAVCACSCPRGGSVVLPRASTVPPRATRFDLDDTRGPLLWLSQSQRGRLLRPVFALYAADQISRSEFTEHAQTLVKETQHGGV